MITSDDRRKRILESHIREAAAALVALTGSSCISLPLRTDPNIVVAIGESEDIVKSLQEIPQ